MEDDKKDDKAAAAFVPSPEKICAKAEEKERADCTKDLTEMKAELDKLNKDLWPEVAICLSKPDKLTQEVAIKCIDNKKVTEAMRDDTPASCRREVAQPIWRS